MSKGYNVLSLFDGISCGQVALQRAGIKVNKYYASEIDQRAITVTQRNWPNTIQFGNVTKIKKEHFMSEIDLLIGGSPCQGFSFAGKQLNFDDPRSKLFFEFVRLKNELNPKYFFLENVRMTKESESIITDLMGVEPIKFDSEYLSPAYRKRLYWTNISGFNPERREIYWDSVQVVGSKKGFYSKKMIDWIFKNEKRADGFTIYRQTDRVKMQMIEASHHKGPSNQRNFGIEDGGLLRYILPVECERIMGVPDGYTKCISTSGALHALGNGWQVDTIVEFFKHLPQL